MTQPIFARLRTYYESVGRALRDQAGVAAVFANTGDIGSSRERIYARFLRTHLPSSCSVVLGGFLFDTEGNESKQLDIMVMDDTAPRFSFLDDENGPAKTFGYIDGCVGVVEIKSTLDSTELSKALDNFAALPNRQPLHTRSLVEGRPASFEDWPYKVIYAANGASAATIRDTLFAYYSDHPEVPRNKRPNLIQVGNDTCVVRDPRPGLLESAGPLEAEDVKMQQGEVDPIALPWAINSMQHIAAAARLIETDYGWIIPKMNPPRVSLRGAP